jgi:hypothetical protein
MEAEIDRIKQDDRVIVRFTELLQDHLATSDRVRDLNGERLRSLVEQALLDVYPEHFEESE